MQKPLNTVPERSLRLLCDQGGECLIQTLGHPRVFILGSTSAVADLPENIRVFLDCLQSEQ